jgi:hypothetical protein
MSWGERSCVNFGNCKIDTTIKTCNTDCPQYIWDKETSPDTISLKKLADFTAHNNKPLLSKRWK